MCPVSSSVSSLSYAGERSCVKGVACTALWAGAEAQHTDGRTGRRQRLSGTPLPARGHWEEREVGALSLRCCLMPTLRLLTGKQDSHFLSHFHVCFRKQWLTPNLPARPEQGPRGCWAMLRTWAESALTCGAPLTKHSPPQTPFLPSSASPSFPVLLSQLHTLQNAASRPALGFSGSSLSSATFRTSQRSP